MLCKVISKIVILILLLGVAYSASAVPTMSRNDLIYYLSNPIHATGHKYGAKDSAGNAMQCVSVIDIVGQTAKYAAVYHAPHNAAGKGFRYKIHLATSNDLINWTHVRVLADNADMPKITKVGNGAWIVMTHEQWMSQGDSGQSQSPSQISFKIFYDSADLLNGTIRSTWTAGQYKSDLNGTPSFYDTSLVQVDGYWCVKGTIGFHFWDGTRDSNGKASFARLAHPQGGTSWSPSITTGYNNKLIAAGVTGNIGQRDTAVVSSGRYNVQEGNVGIPTYSWDKWRIWLYTYEDSYVYPTGTGTLLQLSPQTHGGSCSFGNPGVSFVNRPNGCGQAMFVSLFIFAEGAAPGEEGNLIYYFDI